MGYFFACTCTEVLAVAATLLCVWYAYFQYCFQYWARKDVPFLPPSFPFGNTKERMLQLLAPGEQARRIYNELKKPGVRFGGTYIFNKPSLFIFDPDLIRDIFSKNFQHFYARSNFVDQKHDPLPAHLVTLNGPKWKNLRTKLTPTFTSGKMKMMFQTLLACGESLEMILDGYAKTGEDIDIKETMARFTTDVIGSVAFGLDMNSLNDPDADFRVLGRKIFSTSLWEGVKHLFMHMYPRFFRMLRMKRFSNEINDFFMNVVKNTVEYREKNNVERKDFMQLLIKLKNEGTVEDGKPIEPGMKLSMDELAAQAFVFFLAGFETSSTTMGFCMYDLAKNQDIQDKVRKEIDDMLKRHNGKLTYEGIMELKYMDQVIDESMRMHPPIPLLPRLCTKDYKIPNTNVIIEKGTPIQISTYGLHMDPEFYPNPEKYDPDRFSKEEVEKRHKYVFLPFGEGPRNCIGLRFGLMQAKVGLCLLLKNYKYTLSSKTKEPFEMDPKSVTVLSVKDGIWLRSEKI